MSILAQFQTDAMIKKCFDILVDHIRKIHTSFPSSCSDHPYANLMEDVSDAFRSLCLRVLREELQRMDEAFRQQPERANRYYVKVTRERTLITPFGLLTYQRTIYQNRSTKQCYCHVDRLLKLPKYDRYDPCVKAMVVEAGAQLNSMIKVGEIIGDRIYSTFSLQKDRKRFRISRQTVHQIMKRAKPCVVYPHPTPTPIRLYLMADEKYISLQNRDPSANQPQKQMVKLITVFEQKDTSNSRNPLQNKFSIALTDKEGWQKVHDILNARYDLDKVKHIHIIGDGASWIVKGAEYLLTEQTKTDFSLDLFHAMRALNKITKDESVKNILLSYIYHDLRRPFFKVIESLKSDHPDRQDAIQQQQTYLSNHWSALQNTIRRVNMGCSMEGDISHILASQFTSVPKAYSSQHLSVYVNYRIHYINGLDLRRLYLDALNHPDPETAVFKPSLDLSIFEKHTTVYEKSSHSLWLKGFIARN